MTTTHPPQPPMVAHPRGAEVWGYMADLTGYTAEQAEAAGRAHGAAAYASNTRTASPAPNVPHDVWHAWQRGVWAGYWPPTAAYARANDSTNQGDR